ncbi:nitrate/nitrite transporter NrtS [Henriciella pelagia]|jgi:hypothetical protein|uniref:Phosphoenolpyruvate protein kinase n=1 Tax=Henriciella pelagia TaxID=1977912 RepID=A0ABQ1K2P7_9PROT|nr:nitrate/nitrite transporter NrtS [Henriciella pelagia]GGB81338.1 hypothetical protein GCM10011503_32660 [Henriciella pelagia]
MDTLPAASLADVQRPISFRRALLEPVTVKRALKVGLLVGSILVLINQGDGMIGGAIPPYWKVLLTYCVPYCVSSYSTAMFMVELGRKSSRPQRQDA